MAALLLDLASAVAALSAAICWALSAVVKLPTVRSTEQARAAGTGIGVSEINTAVHGLTKAMHEQAIKAKCGAGFAAAAAFAQALGKLAG